MGTVKKDKDGLTAQARWNLRNPEKRKELVTRMNHVVCANCHAERTWGT
jgi:hypothetical protein